MLSTMLTRIAPSDELTGRNPPGTSSSALVAVRRVAQAGRRMWTEFRGRGRKRDIKSECSCNLLGGTKVYSETNSKTTERR